MTTLLVSEARSIGIESYPALIRTRGEGFLDPDFPDFGFNHVIAVAIIDSDTLWMDPTCETCPFGDLPTGVQNIMALVVTDEGGQLRFTPAAEAQHNHTEKDITILVHGDYHADLLVSMSVTGAYARFLRDRIPGKDADELRQFIHRLFVGANKKYQIKDFNIANLEDCSLPLRIDLEAATLRPFRRIGALVYVDPFWFSDLSRIEKVDLSQRDVALNVYYPELLEDRVTVQWDTSLAVDSVTVPSDADVSFSLGNFSLRALTEAHTIRVFSAKSCHAYQIEPDQFDAFTAYRDGIKEALSKPLKLHLQQ
jgi:hypothetical protein